METWSDRNRGWGRRQQQTAETAEDTKWRRAAQPRLDHFDAYLPEMQENIYRFGSIFFNPHALDHELEAISRMHQVIRSMWSTASVIAHKIRVGLNTRSFTEEVARRLTEDYDLTMNILKEQFEALSSVESTIRRRTVQIREDEQRERESQLPVPTVQDTKLKPIRDFKDLLNNEDECPICMEDYAKEENLVKCPKCGNHMHDKCVLNWLKTQNSCPLCRHKLKISKRKKMVRRVRSGFRTVTACLARSSSQ